MSSGDTFFALLKARLPEHFVEGWDGKDGDELYRAIARVYETASARDVAELRAARILIATGPAKAAGTVTLALAARTGASATILAGTVLFRTAWGVEYVLTANLVYSAIIASPTTLVVDVEARWAGWEGNVDANLVSEWAIPDTSNPAGLTWSGLTTSDGKTQFLAAVESGAVAIQSSTEMSGGLGGTLDLIAQGLGKPRADGEADVSLRARLRSRSKAITPYGIRDAVRAAIGSTKVVIAEPWDWGFAWGVSGWGEEAWMPSLRFAIVLVPEGSDLVALQEFVNRIRPMGYRVMVLEAAPSVFE